MSSAHRAATALGLAVSLALASGAAAVVQATDAAGAPPTVGRPASAQEIAVADITVFPDGTGLPRGSGSARQGRAVYEARCAACHGVRGEGTPNFAPLAGGRGSLGGERPLLTVGSYWPHATTLWDYTRRAMPYSQPGSLTVDEVYGVTAYVLHLSGIVAEDAVLDERSLPAVAMPNRHGFVPDGRPRPGAQAGGR